MIDYKVQIAQIIAKQEIGLTAEEIAEMIETVLNAPEDQEVIAKVRARVNATMAHYPIFAW